MEALIDVILRIMSKNVCVPMVRKAIYLMSVIDLKSVHA